MTKKSFKENPYITLDKIAGETGYAKRRLQIDAYQKRLVSVDPKTGNCMFRLWEKPTIDRIQLEISMLGGQIINIYKTAVKKGKFHRMCTYLIAHIPLLQMGAKKPVETNVQKPSPMWWDTTVKTRIEVASFDDEDLPMWIRTDQLPVGYHKRSVWKKQGFELKPDAKPIWVLSWSGYSLNAYFGPNDVEPIRKGE